MNSLFAQQTKAIIRKNFIYVVRKKQEVLKELAVPLISAMVIYASKPQTGEESDDAAMQKSLDMMSGMTKLMLPLYLPSAITGFAKKHLISFVQEKHERFKETQKIMGMTQSAYICGWLITSYLKMVSIALITILSLYFSGYAGEGFGMIGFNFVIYLIASVHQTFAISTFFDEPKLAGEIGTFILTLTPLLYYYLSYGPQIGSFGFALVCTLPQTAISFAIMGSSEGSQSDGLTNNYSSGIAQLMLFVDVFLYLFLYFYLDEVMPNEYGISKHPLYIFSQKYWKDLFSMRPSNKTKQRKAQSFYDKYDSKRGEDQGQINQNESSNDNQSPSTSNSSFSLSSSASAGMFETVHIEMRQGVGIDSSHNPSMLASQARDEDEDTDHLTINVNKLYGQTDTSSAFYHQQLRHDTSLFSPMQISNLKKRFGKVQAVNGISLNLYEGQILCLLGHNGAGKTTTISLLTGLIEKTEGQIRIFGQELEDDLDGARQEIGLCTQKDVLYEDMTVQEHLDFIARIKGLQGQQAQNEIEYIINSVGLQAERTKLSGDLSGGNKRKLSLGMALTGGSRIIFLDEPTSGMDPVSRQQIWKILEKVRDKRTIVLTTHHLDEAERLADKIAIMSKGELLALGTSEYIKQKFGVGYNLTLSSRNQNSNEEFILRKNELIETIESNIPGAIFNHQSAKDSLKFTLPFSALSAFSQTLRKLESLQCVAINLQINSLEDAYVEIGKTDEKHDDNLALKPQITNRKDIEQSPKYAFWNQFLAMFQRQFYMTTRNWSAILMILLPIAFNLLGVYVAKHFLDNLEELMASAASHSKSKKSSLFPLKMYFLQIFIVQAYSMNSSIYINTPVLERERSLKYALAVMGCRPLPYWLGTFVHDYIVYFLTLLVFLFSVHEIQVDFLNPYMYELTMIMLCFGATLITFCYLCGFLFKNSNSAFKSFPILTFFVSYSIPWVFLVISKSTFPQIHEFLQYLFLATSPFISLEKALENIDGPKENGLSSTDIRSDQVFDTWESYCMIMIGQAIGFFLVTLLIEKLMHSLKPERKNYRQSQTMLPANVDKGVLREAQRVDDMFNSDPIKAKKIHKTYPNGFQAVKGTSFGVEKGQIFGLLGPNGAGKSTTFNIITANIPLTSGEVQLNGREVSENASSYFSNIGVCPQQDCLWDYLVPTEHLKLFGRIKGLSGSDLAKTVEYYTHAMQLDDFNNKAMNLSGGNKRKLCVANALIASPSLQFFDEPSTGLDPIAKRYLWNCLKENLVQKKSSIVLTTHSLMEAEDLCDKVGIQVNGEFVCLDTLQTLKKNNGDGYKVYVKLVPALENADEVIAAIQSAYPAAKLLSRAAEKRIVEDALTFSIPYEGFLFSEVFYLLNDTLKTNNRIEDFSITQTSLEDIFIYFSQFQVTPSNNSTSNGQTQTITV